MSRQLIALLAGAALLAGLTARPGITAQSPAPAVTPQTTIDSGALEGIIDSATGVLVFCGVPYAAPPVGALARLVSRARGKAWFYHFVRVGDGEQARRLGATHTAEIPFVFARVLPEGVA